MFEYSYSGIDYSRTYSAIARRVSAAHAYMLSGQQDRVLEELSEAMAVISQMETTSLYTNTQGK